MRHILPYLLLIISIVGCNSQIETIKVELRDSKQLIINEFQQTYLEKAITHFEKENFDSVLVYCHKSYSIDNKSWELFYLYGKTAFKTERFKLAELYYSKALSLKNTNSKNRAEIYFALAENENSQGNSSKAKQHYLMVQRLDSNSELARTAVQKMQLLSTLE